MLVVETSSDQQTFTVNNGPPVFDNCPDDNWLILNCEDYEGEEGTIDVIEAWIASVTATSACGEPLTVFNNFNSSNIGTCINDGYTNVTFRATDNCGRTTFCTGNRSSDRYGSSEDHRRGAGSLRGM